MIGCTGIRLSEKLVFFFLIRSNRFRETPLETLLRKYGFQLKFFFTNKSKSHIHGDT